MVLAVGDSDPPFDHGDCGMSDPWVVGGSSGPFIGVGSSGIKTQHCT